MRVDASGRVAIPADIQERAGLLPDTEVEVDFDGARVVIRPAGDPPQQQAGRGARLIAHLSRHGGDSPLSTDEIMAMTRGED